MTDDTRDTRPVFQGSSLAEAEMIKGLLEGEGILATIPGEMCTDPVVTIEETVAGTAVHVATEELQRARQVILAARAAGRAFEGWLADHPGESPLPE